MKRLLEWKQKMLQSPLNRKVHQTKDFISKKEYYRNQNEYAQRMQQNMYSNSRRPSNVMPHYSSYSSDDEGKNYELNMDLYNLLKRDTCLDYTNKIKE